MVSSSIIYNLIDNETLTGHVAKTGGILDDIALIGDDISCAGDTKVMFHLLK